MRAINVEHRQVFAYVSVRMDRLGELRQAANQETFKLRDYGNILASGYGEPTVEVVAQMERDYGVKPGLYIDFNPVMFGDELDRYMEAMSNSEQNSSEERK